VQESIDVDVPVGTAYNQWTQFESFPSFMHGVEAIDQLDDTHLHWRIKVAGAEREFDATITEQLPDERVAWKSTQHAGVVTFHRIADARTRVNVQFDWDPASLSEKAGAMIGVDDRQVKSDLKKFKSFIEARGTEAGGWRGSVARPDVARATPKPGDPRRVDTSATPGTTAAPGTTGTPGTTSTPGTDGTSSTAATPGTTGVTATPRPGVPRNEIPGTGESFGSDRTTG
jgi:hypothetical protein